MAKNKKSVLLYCDIIHTVEELNDEEAGRLFKHYLRYINDLNPIAPDKITQIVFEPIKQNLKRDLKKWEESLTKKSEAGKKGMQKRWGNENNNTITEDNTVIKPITEITVKDTVTVNVKDTVKVKDILLEKETKNFFYLGNQMIKTPLSVWLIQNKKIAIEAWCQQNNSDITEVFKEIDRDVGKMLTDEKHAINFFKSTAKKLTDNGTKSSNIDNRIAAIQ